eukprot:gene3189-biopygen7825
MQPSASPTPLPARRQAEREERLRRGLRPADERGRDADVDEDVIEPARVVVNRVEQVDVADAEGDDLVRLPLLAKVGYDASSRQFVSA